MTVELHRLTDDGEPHCTCGRSFRNRSYHEFTDHAITELRITVLDLDRRVRETGRMVKRMHDEVLDVVST